MSLENQEEFLKESFSWRIPKSGSFKFKNQTYTSEDIIEKLSPLLTVERIEKIEKVASERTWSVGTFCDGLYDIGNISAVMRSAESFGFLSLKILERKDAKYKMSDRISRGTEKWLDIERSSDSRTVINNIKKNGYKVLATSLESSKPIQDVDLTKPLYLVLGNEKEGVHADILAQSDEIVRLPMYGFAESFNISVAAALCFREVHAQRLAKFGKSGDMNEEEKNLLKATYILRSIGSDEKVATILKALKDQL